MELQYDNDTLEESSLSWWFDPLDDCLDLLNVHMYCQIVPYYWMLVTVPNVVPQRGLEQPKRPPGTFHVPTEELISLVVVSDDEAVLFLL